MLRGLGLDLGARNAEALHVLVVAGEIGRGEDRRIAPRLAGAGQDLVVDIGDVADIENREAPRPKDAPEEVEDRRRPAVPEVGVVRDGEAADVHPNLPRMDRGEGLDVAGQRVVEAHGESILARGTKIKSAPSRATHPRSDSP